MEISEIGLTILASSMHTDGMQPGTNDMKYVEMDKFVMAMNQIFVENDWTEANFTHSRSVIKSREESLQIAKEVLGSVS